MTRKDYETLAARISAVRAELADEYRSEDGATKMAEMLSARIEGFDLHAGLLARFLQDQDPNFDKARFLREANLNEEP